jgi:adenosylcobinamide kinase / adenosylcobinamide-phosphate guanylyltransferase
MSLIVILGPRRSGKSAVAERLASAGGAPVAYVAPLTVTDDEMASRVRAHRDRRPATWRTVETAEPLAALREADARDTVLLDSLGTWVAETLWRDGAFDERAPSDPSVLDHLRRDIATFAAEAATRPGLTLVVAEEAGWAPVPPGLTTRRWLDMLGDAAQACAGRADRVLLVVAGRTLELP